MVVRRSRPLYIQDICATARRRSSNDDDFDALLERYLDPPARAPNPDYADVVIEIAPEIAAKLRSRHRISAQDVDDAIKGTPPPVEEEAHDEPELRRFFGFTRLGRALFVVGVWRGRTLRVITAFEPDDDESYWRRQRRR